MRLRLLAAAVLAVFCAACGAHACSSFGMDCGDGAVVNGRTMDFKVDLAPMSGAQPGASAVTSGGRVDGPAPAS